MLLLLVVVEHRGVYRHESVAGEAAAIARCSRALRLAAVALVLVMLTQATLTFQRTGPPSIALVIDRSASMDIADRYEFDKPEDPTSTRLESAQRLLLENDGHNC